MRCETQGSPSEIFHFREGSRLTPSDLWWGSNRLKQGTPSYLKVPTGRHRFGFVEEACYFLVMDMHRASPGSQSRDMDQSR